MLVAVGCSLASLSGCVRSDGSQAADASPTTTNTQATTRQPADDALVIESKLAVEGTNVNIGVQGTARNTASVALVDCVIEVTGDVGGKTFSGQVIRNRLDAGAKWEWEVSFGEEADAMNTDTVTNIAIETRASYAAETTDTSTSQ